MTDDEIMKEINKVGHGAGLLTTIALFAAGAIICMVAYSTDKRLNELEKTPPATAKAARSRQ